MIKRVYLEITNACNFDCPFCTNEKGHDYLSLNDIKNYLTQIKDICDYVYLHVLGEPLLHQYINDIFNICDNLKLKVQLVTNGTLLRNHLDILSHESLRKLSISIHSINNLSIGDDYFKTLDYLIENNNKYLELRFYNKQNLDQSITKYLMSLYDRYNVKLTDRFNSYKLKDNVYIKYADLFNWPSINNDFISNTGRCLGGIDQIAILHNSDVTLCCLDPYGLNKIGNLKKNSLKEILNSEDYIYVVNNLKNNKLTKELCTKCSYRQRFYDKNN